MRKMISQESVSKMNVNSSQQKKIDYADFFRSAKKLYKNQAAQTKERLIAGDLQQPTGYTPLPQIPFQSVTTKR